MAHQTILAFRTFDRGSRDITDAVAKAVGR